MVWNLMLISLLVGLFTSNNSLRAEMMVHSIQGTASDIQFGPVVRVSGGPSVKRAIDQWNWDIQHSRTQILSGDSVTFTNLTEDKCFYYGEREYGINLVWGNCINPNVTFLRKAGPGPIHYGEQVAIKINNADKTNPKVGQGFLRYQKREYGINLAWSNEPVYEWIIRSAAGPEMDGKDVLTRGALNSLLGLYNEVEPDFLLYCSRKYGINLRWTKDCPSNEPPSLPSHKVCGTVNSSIRSCPTGYYAHHFDHSDGCPREYWINQTVCYPIPSSRSYITCGWANSVTGISCAPGYHINRFTRIDLCQRQNIDPEAHATQCNPNTTRFNACISCPSGYAQVGIAQTSDCGDGRALGTKGTMVTCQKIQ